MAIADFMFKAIKIRIYPSDAQKKYIHNMLGCHRFVFNKCLDYRKKIYEDTGKSATGYETVKYVTEIKKENPFLRDVNSKVLQQSALDLNSAFQRFFKVGGGYPKYKAKNEAYQSCMFPNGAFMGVRGNRIDLIRDLKDLHYKCSRRDEKYLNKHQDSIKSATLIKSKSGKYYLSVLSEYNPLPSKPIASAVGIDMGVKNFIMTSDGVVYENMRFGKKDAERIKRLNKNLSRKKASSNNREKARIKLARAYEKIANKRNYYNHIVALSLLNENQVIAIEDLNVRGMVKNRNLSASISDAGFRSFREVLCNKAKKMGRQVVIVDRFFASTKTCHCCGYKNNNLTLKDRFWICPVCGERLDRDINAAANILYEGIRKIGLSSPEFKPADHPTVDDKLYLEILKSSGGKNRETKRVA